MSGWLGLLGLGLRSGELVLGVDGVRRELRSGGCHCVVVARDAGPRAEEKVLRLARARNVPLIAGPGARELGDRLGRPPLMVVGVRSRALADGIVRAAGRL